MNDIKDLIDSYVAAEQNALRDAAKWQHIATALAQYATDVIDDSPIKLDQADLQEATTQYLDINMNDEGEAEVVIKAREDS